MIKWIHESWDFFVNDLGRPSRVFLTTYGFHPEFLSAELLPWLLQISSKRGTSEWFVEMEDALKLCPVDVVVDARQWASSNRDTIFESLGGRVYSVEVPNGNQHAKLWLAEYPDKLRIAIGSANLTRSGFSEQIQYIWMADLIVSDNENISNEPNNTDILLKFLYGLLNSAKNSQHDSDLLKNWQNSLKKAKYWPKEATLIPVIPGPSGKKSKPGSLPNGLEKISQKLSSSRLKDSVVDIQVFSVGTINTNFISALKQSFHAKTLNLIWPEETCAPN